MEEQEKNNINPDDIVSCLNKYPKARVKYLEHLVLERKIQVSSVRMVKIGIGFRMQIMIIKPKNRQCLEVDSFELSYLYGQKTLCFNL